MQVLDTILNFVAWILVQIGVGIGWAIKATVGRIIEMYDQGFFALQLEKQILYVVATTALGVFIYYIGWPLLRAIGSAASVFGHEIAQVAHHLRLIFAAAFVAWLAAWLVVTTTIPQFLPPQNF